MLPPLARKILRWTYIVGPVCGAITTLWVTYSDISDRTSSAAAQGKVSYDTLAPAVTELQEILIDAQEWVEDTDTEILDLQKVVADQERRIIRLETYIEMLGMNRNLPDAPPEPVGAVALDVGPMSVVMHDDGPHLRKKTTARKPARPIPKDVGGAKAYQQQRTNLGCPPGDPLCGVLE